MKPLTVELIKEVVAKAADLVETQGKRNIRVTFDYYADGDALRKVVVYYLDISESYYAFLDEMKLEAKLVAAQSEPDYVNVEVLEEV